MKINYIENPTESQKESLNSIPDDILNLLKALTVEQQMSCIYVNQTDVSGIKITVGHDPTVNFPFDKCFNLLKWDVSEVFVLDGVIVEVSDSENRKIRFGSAFLEKQRITYDYMDSHDHGIYTETRDVNFKFYLIIFKNHNLLADIPLK